jgi:hypothetical protein
MGATLRDRLEFGESRREPLTDEEPKPTGRQAVGRSANGGWAPEFGERVVRDDDELQRVRQYILDDPAKRVEDPNNPAIIQAKT